MPNSVLTAKIADTIYTEIMLIAITARDILLAYTYMYILKNSTTFLLAY